MRKLSILSYIFAGLMLSSCDGYLKEDPRDQLYPEDAYDTPQNVYLNTVASLYNYIGGYIQFHIFRTQGRDANTQFHATISHRSQIRQHFIISERRNAYIV